MLTLELPYPPSANRLYRRIPVRRGGRVVGSRTLISREGRAYYDECKRILRPFASRKLEGDLAVEVEVYPPDRRRRDLDNTQKALFDALTKGGVYRDDSQIKRIQTEMMSPVDGGRVIVRIGALREGRAR